MEIFAKLESWDYLAAAMLLFSAWLLLGGIVAGALYLACRYLQL